MLLAAVFCIVCMRHVFGEFLASTPLPPLFTSLVDLVAQFSAIVIQTKHLALEQPLSGRYVCMWTI